MRLWSIHPKYLDSKGLVALWREALLAKKVLQQQTTGYKKHPQLERFKNHPSPISYINAYLKEIYNESKKRNFNFDQSKIGRIYNDFRMTVTSEQIYYEFKLLLKKLKERDPVRYQKQKDMKMICTHPIFIETPGSIETWEKIKAL
jgi:hypothetical protein